MPISLPPRPVLSQLALWLALVFLLGSCTEEVGTSIRVSLVYKDSWRIGSADVIASGGEERAPIAREMLMLIPDAKAEAGEVMPIEIWGVRDGERIAHGDAVVLPRKGVTVGATVVLERLPCGVFCAVGELQCDGAGGGTSTCITDADDCLAWSEPAACPAATPFCTSGECRVDCDDECADDEGVCVDATTERRCGQFDADSCRDFGGNQICAGGQTCYGGRCAAPCTYGPDLVNTPLPATTAGAISPSLVADGSGGLHAVYSAGGGGELMYLRKPRDGDWSAPVMIGAAGESPSLAIGKDGTLHVAFFFGGLRYGVRASNGTWSFITVEAGAEVGASHAIALDGEGVVHIVYQDTDDGTDQSLLRHAFGGIAAFVLETADTQLGYRCDLAVVGNTLHVVSYSDTNNVWYSTRGTGAWASVRIVDLLGVPLSAVARTSLVVDRAGTVHVAYTDTYGTSDWLQYTSRAMAGGWRAPISIDRGNGNRTGGLPELAIDLFDGLHVAYRTTAGTLALQYGYRAAGASSTWQLVALPITPCNEPAVAVDAANGLHILSSARPSGLIETTRACQ
jgi:hypothetical protein